ncbi:MAG TPA: hypothetical protein VFC68_03555, partial [Treponemataceae bacterium]|nr:hypothetical protein [Treponemataceae bacterium]
MSYYNKSINYFTRYKSQTKKQKLQPAKKLLKVFIAILKPALSILFFAFLLLSFTQLFATEPIKAGEESWRYLETAKIAYDGGELGKALKLAEDARRSRRVFSEWAYTKLSAAYTPITAKRLGTDIH